MKFARLRIPPILLLSILIFSGGLFAQTNSQYSVRFNLNELNCTEDAIYIDLEIKAKEGFPKYFIAEQNYRFSFNDDAVINPRIVSELEIAGNKFGNGYYAFFDPHHLNGSIDTIVSYNVVLNGGTGYPIGDTRWYPVGRIGFDLIDTTKCLELKWHTQAPQDFPWTSVIEKDGSLYALNEGNYDNGGPNMDPKIGAIACFEPDCIQLFPVEIDQFVANEKECSTELIWSTLSETNSDYFSIEKSHDGIEWFSIGKIAGAGTSTEFNTYRFLDKAILKSLNYYRLKQVDFDGMSSITNPLALRSSCFEEEMEVGITQVFPNPVKNDDRINIVVYTRRNNEATLTISDASGRVVKGIKQTLLDGRNVISFKADELAPGMYFVKVTGDEWYSITRKFVKIFGP